MTTIDLPTLNTAHVALGHRTVDGETQIQLFNAAPEPPLTPKDDWCLHRFSRLDKDYREAVCEKTDLTFRMVLPAPVPLASAPSQ